MRLTPELMGRLVRSRGPCDFCGGLRVKDPAQRKSSRVQVKGKTYSVCHNCKVSVQAVRGRLAA